MDGIRQALDPNRTLEGWLRQQGWGEQDIANTRLDFDCWLYAIRLRQQDPVVRAAQDQRAGAYQAAVALEEAKRAAREADAAAKRAAGGRR